MITLKDHTTLVGARSHESGWPIDVYDDGYGPVWAYGHEYGVLMFVRAQSFEDAYSIAIDESPTIDEADVPEAYGFEGPDAREQLDAAVAAADAGDGEWPELVEGYVYQDNGSDTGIVAESPYAWLREATRKDARFVVRAWDHEAEAARVVCERYGGGYTMTVRGVTKRFRSYSIIRDVGARLRRLERAIGACNVDVSWEAD